ncbi:MAG: hypothetical protein R2724_07035 [Bryobacterales bacterium]
MREHIFAIDRATGKLIDSFGEGGAIDVEKELDRPLGEGESVASTTPGVVFEDLLIVPTRNGEGPSKSSPGPIRAYDCRTGKRRWIFHTIPHPGEFGYETWSPDSWKEAGGTNCWGGMSVDHERGLVFFGLGSPAFDFGAADARARICSATAWSAWTHARASASGTIRPSTTTCGITTSPARRTW